MSCGSARVPLALWDSERRKRRPRTLAGLCHFCCLGAEGGGEAIHDVAASAQILAGIGRALRKAAQDQHAVGGEFAGIFGRRIVAWRQGEWHGLDEAGLWLGLEASQKLFFAGRDEAAYGHEAAHGALHDAIDFGGVFFGCFAHGEAHMVEEGRAKEREIAHGIPAPGGIKHRVADVGESDEAIGMARLPQRPRGIEADVAANGLELPRIEGKLDEAVAVPARPLRGGWCRGRDGGLQPPNPCGGWAILPLWQHGVIAHGEVAEILAGEGYCFGEGGIDYRGFGGGAPVRSPLQRPKDFCCIHQPVRGPQRAEGNPQSSGNAHDRA